MILEPITLKAYPSSRKNEEIIVELWAKPRFDSNSYKRIVTTQEKLDMFILSLSAMVGLL